MTSKLNEPERAQTKKREETKKRILLEESAKKKKKSEKWAWSVVLCKLVVSITTDLHPLSLWFLAYPTHVLQWGLYSAAEKRPRYRL